MELLGRARAGASRQGLSAFFSQERVDLKSVYSRRSALGGLTANYSYCRHLCYHIAITDRCPRIIQDHIARPTACLAICPKLPLEDNSGCRARLQWYRALIFYSAPSRHLNHSQVCAITAPPSFTGVPHTPSVRIGLLPQQLGSVFFSHHGGWTMS